jgi:hypothetical protein
VPADRNSRAAQVFLTKSKLAGGLAAIHAAEKEGRGRRRPGPLRPELPQEPIV